MWIQDLASALNELDASSLNLLHVDLVQPLQLIVLVFPQAVPIEAGCCIQLPPEHTLLSDIQQTPGQDDALMT